MFIRYFMTVIANPSDTVMVFPIISTHIQGYSVGVSVCQQLRRCLLSPEVKFLSLIQGCW